MIQPSHVSSYFKSMALVEVTNNFLIGKVQTVFLIQECG